MEISMWCLGRRFIADTGGAGPYIIVNILSETWPEILPGKSLSSFPEAEMVLIVVMLPQQGFTSLFA
jgi:hypothetical protein